MSSRYAVLLGTKAKKPPGPLEKSQGNSPCNRPAAQPRYDTKSYCAYTTTRSHPTNERTANAHATVGRWRHFASITSPLTLLASSDDLKRAQKLLQEYQEGVGEGRKAWGHEDQYGVWKAKQCESALSLGLDFRVVVQDC